MIRVLIADDHAVVRSGVEQALTGYADVELAGSAGSGPEAVTLAREREPEVVLMDLGCGDGRHRGDPPDRRGAGGDSRRRADGLL